MTDNEIAALVPDKRGVWLAIQGPEGYDLPRLVAATGCRHLGREDFRGAALIRLADC
jgi:hypothetical protein